MVLPKIDSSNLIEVTVFPKFLIYQLIDYEYFFEKV